MKLIKTLICIGSLIFIGLMSANAEIVPTYSPGQFIYWGGGNVIMADKNGSVPNVGDWNGDGLKDLLVGVYTSGHIFYMENTGTNENPVFETRVNLTTQSGQPITLSYG